MRQRMKLIIELLEEDYNRIKDMPDAFDSLTSRTYKSIKNGTPLPKGHGRLIDADELKKHKHHDERFYENVVAVAQIDWAETIIEADKEVKND